MSMFESIVSEKVREMELNGEIKRKIEENVERSIFNAIEKVFGPSYSNFNEGLQNKMKNEIPIILQNIDLSGANEFILSKTKEYINCLYKLEASDKIVKNLESIFIKNYHGITIEDIYYKFLDMIKDMSDDDIYRDDLDIDDDNYCSFIFEMNKVEDKFSSSSNQYKVTIRKKADEEYISFTFIIHDYYYQLKSNPNERCILSLDIYGKPIDERIDLSKFNDFELMLINIYLSKTKIDFLNLENEHFETEIEL